MKGTDSPALLCLPGLVLAFLLALAAAGPAQAQIPPHAPGTLCFTQTFWCWAQPPGPPGTPCACPTPQGWVPGVRG